MNKRILLFLLLPFITMPLMATGVKPVRKSDSVKVLNENFLYLDDNKMEQEQYDNDNDGVVDYIVITKIYTMATAVPAYLGQLAVDSGYDLYIATGTSAGQWEKIADQ